MKTSACSSSSPIRTTKSINRSRWARKASRSEQADRRTTWPLSVRVIQEPPVVCTWIIAGAFASEALGQHCLDPPLPPQPPPTVEGASPPVHIGNRDLDQVPQLVHASSDHARQGPFWYLVPRILQRPGHFKPRGGDHRH